MRSLIIAFLFAWGNLLSAQTTLYIAPGSQLVSDGNVQFVLEETDWKQDGSFVPGQSRVVFRSDQAVEQVLGSSSPAFFDMELDFVSGELELLQTIDLGGALIFTQGDLDLHGESINMGALASLLQEADNRRVYDSQGGGTLSITVSLNAPTQNPGNLGLTISSNANLGSTVVTRGHDAQTLNGNAGIQRYYDVAPATNTALNATISLTYFDNELNGVSESDFDLFRSTDGGSTWIPFAASQHFSAANRVELTGINEMGRFSTTTTGAFPVTWLAFDARWRNQQARRVAALEWVTGQEFNSDYFVVWRKIEGFTSGWEALGQVDAAGFSDEEQHYEFVDGDIGRGDAILYQYRLEQFDLDGSSQMSQVVSLRVEQHLDYQFQAYPNPARDHVNLLAQLPDKDFARSLHLLSAQGQMVYEKQFDFTGNVDEAVSVDHLPEGVYFLVLRTAQEQTLRRSILILH